MNRLIFTCSRSVAVTLFVHTWGVDAANTDRLLKECLDLGLTVTIGLRLADFDYETDEGKKATQRILIIHEVKKYRNHHSLLIWGLGNELEHNVDEIGGDRGGMKLII